MEHSSVRPLKLRSFIRLVRIPVLLICIAVAAPPSLWADIAEPAPWRNEHFDISLSLEPLLSLERPVGSRGSLMIWGGGALLATVRSTSTIDAGGEIALEARIYRNTDRSLRGVFAGVYAGTGIVAEIGEDGNGSSDLWTVGLKVGSKGILFGSKQGTSHPRGAIEPYASVGCTTYFGRDDAEFAHANPEYVVWLNLGMRFVIEF